jgi:hypothetical protein
MTGRFDWMTSFSKLLRDTFTMNGPSPGAAVEGGAAPAGGAPRPLCGCAGGGTPAAVAALAVCDCAGGGGGAPGTITALNERTDTARVRRRTRPTPTRIIARAPVNHMTATPRPHCVALVRQFFAFINGGRYHDVLSLLAPDCEAFGGVGSQAVRLEFARYVVRATVRAQRLAPTLTCLGAAVVCSVIIQVCRLMSKNQMRSWKRLARVCDDARRVCVEW